MTPSIFLDLSPGEIDLLLALREADADPPNGRQVIDAYQQRRDGAGSDGTLTSYLRRLDARGYVASDKEGRERLYRLTDKGANTLWTLRDDIDAALEDDHE
jgi:DNA-binding PadR family transcriptional regulator